MIQINNIELINNKIITIEEKYNIKNIDLDTNTITISLDQQTTTTDNTISNRISFSNYNDIVYIRK